MSKFYADPDSDDGKSEEDPLEDVEEGDSDSDSSDSDSNSGLSSDDEDAPEKKKIMLKPTYMDTSSDEDEEKRKVVPEREKRFLPMRAMVTTVNEKMKIKDFIALLSLYEELNKMLAKAKKVTEKEGVPRFYIRTIFMLGNLVNTITNAEKKKYNKHNALAFNKLRQRIKKTLKFYHTEIDEFKANPIVSGEDEDEETESETETSSDDDEPSKSKPKPKRK